MVPVSILSWTSEEKKNSSDRTTDLFFLLLWPHAHIRNKMTYVLHTPTAHHGLDLTSVLLRINFRGISLIDRVRWIGIMNHKSGSGGTKNLLVDLDGESQLIVELKCPMWPSYPYLYSTVVHAISIRGAIQIRLLDRPTGVPRLGWARVRVHTPTTKASIIDH